MKDKAASAVFIIGGADGPTSVFIAGKRKKSLRQRWRKVIYNYRRNRFIKSLKANPHSMDKVMEYIKNRYGYVEKSREGQAYKEDYIQMRASFILQYEPELLGDLWEAPKLKAHTEAEVRHFMQQMEERQKRAEQIPTEVFDIDFHMFELKKGKFTSNIVIEKKYGYIGGSAAGDKSHMKNFRKIFHDIYLYYGVSQRDIDNKTRRYKELVKTLAAW